MKCFIIFFVVVLILSRDLCRADVSFTEHLIDGTFLNVSSVSATDINGDSLVDILGTAWDLNTVAWWSNDGEGGINETRLVIDNTFAGATFAVAVDLDGDGLMDVVGTAWNGNEVAWWKNEGGIPYNGQSIALTATSEVHTRSFRLTWMVTTTLTFWLPPPPDTRFHGGRIWAAPP